MNNEQIPQAAYVMIQKESESFISEARNITRSVQGFGETQPESAKRIFKAGGKFGYSLAADQLRKKDEEIERMKWALVELREDLFLFVEWYSGMTGDKIKRAFERYKTERFVPQNEEEYNEALRDSKHELTQSPITTPKDIINTLNKKVSALSSLPVKQDAKVVPMVTVEETSKLIVQSIGNYVNGLDRNSLGVPLMDEVAVMQMEYMVSQIISDPSKPIEIPQYD